MHDCANPDKTMETDDVKVTVVKETEKAYLFKSEDGEEAYFPKSQVSFKRRNMLTGVTLAEIPLWLLTEKGWNQ